MALFQELNRQGITLLLVTHEADVARFARRVLRFRDGKVIADEPSAVPEDARRLLQGEAAAAA
jgi:putative ABC transport system ATP-binding protein